MRLRICREDGTERTVEATEAVVASLLAEMGALQFLICESEDGRFMQDNGEHLEYGEPSGGPALLRADPDDVRARGTLAAFASFLRGDDGWRDAYRWEDVRGRLRAESRRRILVALIPTLAVLAALLVAYLVIR